MAAEVAPPMPVTFGYRWFSRRLLPERRGHRCRIVSHEQRTIVGGSVYMASRGVTVQFEDGFTVAAERGMLKRAEGWRRPLTSSEQRAARLLYDTGRKR